MRTSQAARKFSRAGRPMVCGHCENTSFYTRRSLLNTPGLAFFSLDWLNKDAQNFICSKCGQILWFIDLPRE